MAWINTQPKIRDLAIKINNEGKRSPWLGNEFNKMGMHRGASDLFLAFPIKSFQLRPYYGLWIELKRSKVYTPSERKTVTWIKQEEFLLNMRNQGYAARMCFGANDAIEIIEQYLLGLIIL